MRSGWRIHFVPGPKLLRNGNDPLRLLRELATLGACEVRVDAKWVPPLTELDPEECRLSWRVELTGVIQEAAIRSVFDWVEGECDLKLEAFGPVADSGAELPAPVSAATAIPVVAPRYTWRRGRSMTPKARHQARRGRVHPTTAAAGVDSGSIRVSIDKIDELLNSVGELVITQSVLSQLAAPLEGAEADELRSALGQLERHMRNLQESVMRVRMLPISSVFNRFPRLVRDLGQRLGKKIELRLNGDSTELDKTVLEKIGDPLVHLVRNAIDHGIETPEVRLAAGKPGARRHRTQRLSQGRQRRSSKCATTAADSSATGSWPRRASAAWSARTRSSPRIAFSISSSRPASPPPTWSATCPAAAWAWTWSSATSTSSAATCRFIRRTGKGSMVRIRLPLTLAILDGQLARVGSEVYVVPIVSIVETIQVREEQVSSVAARAHVFRMRDDYLPIVRLYELFGIEPQHTDLLDGLLMIVEADGKRVGLFVDELMSQQQVVIKSLETNFRPVVGLAGATMLGDGRVALILDIPGVISRFQSQETRHSTAQQAA